MIIQLEMSTAAILKKNAHLKYGPGMIFIIDNNELLIRVSKKNIPMHISLFFRVKTLEFVHVISKDKFYYKILK